jgi:hypothetical protein
VWGQREAAREIDLFNHFVPPCYNREHLLTRQVLSLVQPRFASFTMCSTINLAMSALIFTGDLQEVLPGKLAVRGNRGEQCAVCETCKALNCNVLG